MVSPISDGVAAMVTPTSRRISTFSLALSPNAEMMAPAWPMRAAVRCAQARDIGDHGLGHVITHEFGSLGLLGAADLSNHDDCGGFRICFEQRQDIA